MDLISWPTWWYSAKRMVTCEPITQTLENSCGQLVLVQVVTLVEFCGEQRVTADAFLCRWRTRVIRITNSFHPDAQLRGAHGAHLMRYRGRSFGRLPILLLVLWMSPPPVSR